MPPITAPLESPCNTGHKNSKIIAVLRDGVAGIRAVVGIGPARPPKQESGGAFMSVAQMFEGFYGQLALAQTLRSSISTRTGRIVGRLNSDFRSLSSDTANRFYAGSYGRNTAVPGLSDIDLIYVLPYATYTQYNAYTGNQQSSLLQAGRTSLNQTYPNSAVIADGQIVKINFIDNITYEIVPVFPNKDGSFNYADSNNGGSWKTCKPKHEIDAFYERDINSNRNLVVLGRMARAWRDHNNVNMSGMLIDTLAFQFMADWAYKDKSYLYYDYLTRDFFSYLGQQDRDKDYWLAPGSGSRVYFSDRELDHLLPKELRRISPGSGDSGIAVINLRPPLEMYCSPIMQA